MDSRSSEILHEFPPFFKVYKDGRIEKLWSLHFAPPSDDPETGVRSKDVVILPECGVSARIFIPKINGPDQKFPILLHIHGGGFCAGSPFEIICQNFLNSLTAEANIIVVSVDYRLAPEHHLPIAYDDSWDALQWIASHSTRSGPDPWLNEHGNFGRVFVAGESAGANIAHNVVIRAGVNPPPGLDIIGLILLSPFFGGAETDNMYKFLCPSSSGSGDDPKLNPAVDPNLPGLGCRKVFVCVAEKDGLRGRGWEYHETVKKSGWGGCIEIEEAEGEDHCFHMFNPSSSKLGPLLKKLSSFINHD
ncbi:Alpha/beta hydrolase fold-3 [Dillenia turbinata]|uniref:Alpha/beta hydrolase fold-3 n=1 Tax=Dillenia turbinata TaxID=194707 RepID=A0AAN8WDW9_9MAGN